MPYQVRAKTACDAVGYDRDRFNEDVASGAYPCAPPTDQGRPRIFEEPDLIALYVHAYLRRMGVGADLSGSIACRVGDQARQLVNNGKELAGDVVIGWDHVGSSFCGIGADVSSTLDRTNNGYGGTFSPMVVSMRFALANVLTVTKQRVEELIAPKGED
ncbi:hypothetical protein [Brevundimonas aurantiaca]|uniref:hypothetical protein n=1 Tax=Brevundimonas aurantiaca TaxID=74316 RepID=UPI00174C07B6|nr:hypothetical protein [Brevundimonas aurantiaca]